MSTVYNRRTEAIVRGAITGGTDSLGYTAINIVRVGNSSTTTDFNPISDYILSTSGEVSWLPLGGEPSIGSVYYVTYDYYPETRIKTIDNIITEMRADIKTNNSQIDISEGEPANDIFIEVPAKQIADVYKIAEHVSLIQSLKSPDEFTEQELDDYAYNFNITRKSATKSTGNVTFGLTTASVSDIVIPVGSQVATIETTTTPSISFRVTTTTVLLAGAYSVVAPVEALVAGVAGNAGANSIVTISTPISGITSVINSGATTGGTDSEPNASLSARIIGVWTGANIGTKKGIANLMIAQDNVTNAFVQGWGDPLMTRDNGYGGKADVYILAESGFSTSIIDEESTYAGTGDVLLLSQPVLSIDEVKVNNVVASSSTYTLVKDISGVAKSNRAQDALRFTTPPSPSDNIKVSYTYNGLINTLQALIDEDVNHIVTADVLVKDTDEILINMAFAISVADGYVFDTVMDNVATAITDFVNAKGLESTILYSSIINCAHDVEGVVEVQVPFTLLAKDGESTIRDIILTAKEYPRIGTITITEI